MPRVLAELPNLHRQNDQCRLGESLERFGFIDRVH